jgi:wobble nucleotide-excising tRNase
MLHEVIVASTASYSDSGQRLDGLKQVNFIFGANGSGKTSISRVIANPNDYAKSSLSWLRGSALDRRVFNCDFSAKNLTGSTTPGVFTLGEENVETKAKIEAARTEISRCRNGISGLMDVRDGVDRKSGKNGELVTLRDNFELQCWAYKTAHDAHFANAFEGLRNNKAKFCDRVLSEYAENDAAVHELDVLKDRASTIFEKGVAKVEAIPVISLQDLISLEGDPVLAKKVIGKEDVDVAALIKKLGNSDWVKQGLAYVGGQDDLCPFCQQGMPHRLVDHLNEYFDETYLADLSAIDRLDTAYAEFARAVLERLALLAANVHRYIDATLLQAEIDRLTDRLALNVRLIAGKKKEPSTPISLEALTEIESGIAVILDRARSEAVAHNVMVDNLEAEKANLTNEIWKYVLTEGKDVIESYQKTKDSLEKAVAGLTAGIDKFEEQQRVATAELIALEKSITSVQPTVTEINQTLASFGFTNFALATAGESESDYKIVRRDGSDAATTLSEGERGFITFLYFYHLVRGSITQTGTSTERIVVFDDPVSSLDSDVLFIVSSLIRKMVDEAIDGSGQIKQVIILTHNIYFHKEVSFDSKRGADVCRSHETFWVVRKADDVSQLIRHVNNPIKTSYELLWAEVKNENRSKATIQNTLRRILENYFKILGNTDFNDIVDKFEGRDKIICGSLFSWVHDGSHSFNDDLYLTTDDSVIDRYLTVFRQIFEKTDHMGHYRMMMGDEASVAQIAVNQNTPGDPTYGSAAAA